MKNEQRQQLMLRYAQLVFLRQAKACKGEQLEPECADELENIKANLGLSHEQILRFAAKRLTNGTG